MNQLVVNPGTPQSWEIQLNPGINSLGRGSHNEFEISDASVSTSHCEIVVTDSHTKIKDLGSTNGTFLDGIQIQESKLKDGQSLRLGNVEMLFHSDSANSAPAARPLRINLSSAHATSALVAEPAVAAEPMVSIAPASPAPSVSALKPAGLRLASSAPPTTESATIDETPPLPPSFAAHLAATPSSCRFHPKSPARYLCRKCNRMFCELCVSTRAAAGRNLTTCRSCGVECVPVQQPVTVSVQKSFYSSIPGAFVYPFRGTGILIIVIGAMLLAVLNVVGNRLIGSIFIRIAAIGYIFSFMQSIIHSTASEDPAMPDLPGTDDLSSGFFNLVGTILMSFGLAIALVIAKAAFEMDAIPMAAIFVAVLFGCIYFPMAFLATAMKDTALASNPLIVIPSILKVPWEYVVTVVLTTGIFGVQKLGDVISSASGHTILTTKSAGVVAAIFGFRILWSLISLYLLTVNMRILGLLYLKKKNQLGWF